MNNINDLLTIQEVANRLKVTPQYARKLIKEEKLIATRIGTQWVIKPDDLDTYISKYDVSIEPDDHARISDTIPDIVALSFFSGAMGLDIGMRKGGIPAILACEFNKYCRMTIAENEPDMALIGDINKYEPEQILEMAKLPHNRKVDVIFGGPPCQAFSTAGARRALDDERGNVFLRYVKIVEKIRPTYVVIENVRGLLSAPYPYNDVTTPIKGGALCVILDRLKAAGYTISFELYNAANFGAPQIRERVVMIGKLGNEKVSYLSPTHDENGDYELAPWQTLRDAVNDIEDKEQHYIEFPEKRLKFYRMLTEGQYWKDLPPEAQKEAMGAKLKLGGGKTGFFRRLSFNRPSPTLVTDPTMPATDLCHPTADRPLSVEEYARIQGFPDDWKICGPIKEQYRQIGNAVPIKLGEAIAKTILADMNGEVLPQIPGYSYSRYKSTSDISWRISMDEKLKKARAEQENEQLSLSFD
ncbi:DNA cytosine methyltransferase [Blautia sp. MSJ-36]|uniref:DNA cytosine methyltransferase n=1 Tax=Blautia sp. MSJ-36 TaxID=2841530 RepID=UPI001C110D4F|nr:DNA cytosine methyltransferase [Blautia sp. MSJ-36]MBU5446781.1 DNA cytosine methyltransferase [Blautia sp. MSJ-36]